MTPPRAATPAGRRASGAPAAPSYAPREEIRITATSQRAMAGAARAAVRASAAAAGPRHVSRPAPGRSGMPRRVSGPLSGRVAAAAAAVALPQRAPVPLPAPRRRPTPVTRPSRRDLPGGARALAWVRGLPDHRLLDRLIGGRVWIVLIGTLLVGIVTVQLSLLKLNAGIGRAVERTSQLEQRNATLRATISQLSDSERVVAAARRMGYVVPLQGSPRYRRASAGDARRAIGVMRVPQTSPTTSTATTLAATGAGVAATTDPATTTAADPTATTDTTTAVTSDPGTATATTTTAPTATVPSTATGAAGTTTAGTTAGATAAGGATAPAG